MFLNRLNGPNDGRSAVNPVRTIKKAAQLAADSGVKESIIVSGGDYVEDKPGLTTSRLFYCW